MKKKFIVVLLIVCSILIGISCRKVQRPLPQPGQLNKVLLEDLPDTKGIWKSGFSDSTRSV